MDDYLPQVYVNFRDRYPEAADALGRLGAVTEASGPLDERTQRLVKLGLAIGALAEGAVRSSVRKALGLGLTPDEIRHVSLLAVTTAGFPTAIAGLRWIDEVLERSDDGSGADSDVGDH
jgi:alkylhydroperoxidase/carboxymuconolactone decarboxylase family protein YurZ